MKSFSSYRFAQMKSSIVAQILSGAVSVTDAARTCKVSRKTLCQWMTKYKAYGTEGLIAQRMGPKKRGSLAGIGKARKMLNYEPKFVE